MAAEERSIYQLVVLQISKRKYKKVTDNLYIASEIYLVAIHNYVGELITWLHRQGRCKSHNLPLNGGTLAHKTESIAICGVKKMLVVKMRSESTICCQDPV